MSNLLKKYASQYKEERVVFPENQGISDDAYDNYERAKEKKTVIECIFSYADMNGDLSLVDRDGIKVILTLEDFQADVQYYNIRKKDRFLGRIIYSKVKEVDRENGVVYVQPAGTSNTVTSQLIREICTELRKHEADPTLEPITVWGCIQKVTPRSVQVNVLNRNILAFISRADWSPVRVNDLTHMAKKGDIIHFDIIGQAERRHDKPLAFIGSRKNHVPDPWLSLHEFKKGDTLICECVERPKRKSYWWGVSEAAPGIEIICDYSQRFNVMRLCTYKCMVRDFDREKHIFMVTPFEQIDKGMFNRQNVEFAKGKKKGAAEDGENG